MIELLPFLWQGMACEKRAPQCSWINCLIYLLRHADRWIPGSFRFRESASQCRQPVGEVLFLRGPGFLLGPHRIRLFTGDFQTEGKRTASPIPFRLCPDAPTVGFDEMLCNR